MSGLAFLSADLAVAPAPPARSALASDVEAAGARSEARDGWLVAVDFGDRDAELRALRETVAVVDVSQRGALELQAREQELDGLAALPGTSAGEGVSAGMAARRQDAWWCRLTPARALVLCEPGATRALRERLSTELPGGALDVTSAYAKLVLAGPLAREALARFCALDVRERSAPVGALLPGSVARTPGLVLREANARFALLLGAAYASYAWEVVTDAVASLGGRPAGVDALAQAHPIDADAQSAAQEARDA